MQVKGTAWRVIKLALDSVRPFVWDTLVLKDAAAAQGGLDPEDEASLTAFLEGKVGVVLCSGFCFQGRGAAAGHSGYQWRSLLASQL
jgi:hypothetical protein